MTKRIVICCDGTWNEPETVESDRIVPTNVLKMVRAVAPRDEHSGIEQVVYYDQGIGTGALGVLDRTIGGGTGYGISRNIRDCYAFLANNYVDGDEIFLFGFSRGAYTVRSLSGMISTVGFISKNDLRYMPAAYAYYHTEPKQRHRSPFHELRKTLKCKFPEKIKFIGVWDTVGALGIPTPVLGKIQTWVGRKFQRFKVGFHDSNLLKIVENAYQALAIDERRGPFRPALWDKATGQRNVQQVWFAGAHSNIGGGYPDAGLSDLALKWMAGRAMECGLVMNAVYLDDAGRVAPSEHGTFTDSYGIGYKMLEYAKVKPYVRPIGQHPQVGEMIHESVVRRIQSNVDPRYEPANVLGNDGTLHVISDRGRRFVEIAGARVPIFKEREHIRKSAGDAQARVTLNDRTNAQGRIVDFAETSGARLRVDGGAQVGERLRLESPLIGVQESTVIWRHGDEIGVRFVA
jgi:hypothetical protein